MPSRQKMQPNTKKTSFLETLQSLYLLSWIKRVAVVHVSLKYYSCFDCHSHLTWPEKLKLQLCRTWTYGRFQKSIFFDPVSQGEVITAGYGNIPISVIKRTIDYCWALNSRYQFVHCSRYCPRWRENCSCNSRIQSQWSVVIRKL